jgi:hypothetical protein
MNFIGLDSNRNLFVGGMALQVIGCACIATGTLAIVGDVVGTRAG